MVIAWSGCGHGVVIAWCPSLTLVNTPPPVIFEETEHGYSAKYTSSSKTKGLLGKTVKFFISAEERLVNVMNWPQ